MRDEGSGKFCTGCGTRLAPADPSGTVATAAPLADWSRESRYAVLIAHAEVHELIAHASARAGKRVPIEMVYEIYDKQISKSLYGVSSAALTPHAADFWTHFGVKTGKEGSETIASPIGRAIVAVLCSLASRGDPIKVVHQADDGCAIEATLPPDLISYDGTLFVTISAEGDRSRVEARTRIEGQMYDWGKSKRCLEGIFEDLRSFRS